MKAQTITGKVTDANSGEKIVGASVKLLGTDKGTLTDATGAFSLEGKGKLQITFVGYKTLEIKTKEGFLQIEQIGRASCRERV